jgi:hypothetical protein
MSIDNLITEVTDTVENYVYKNMEMIYCGRENVGLDMRCGTIFINEECIAVPKYNQGTLEYYGGFEYVDKEYRYTMGEYVFYLAEDNRVREHIERYFDRDEEAA